MSEFVKVAKVADIGAGTMKGFVVGDIKLMIANIGGKFYAVEDRCTHMNAKLSTGMLMGKTVMCMAHGAQFDVTTGAVMASPANKPAKTYEVRVNGDDLEINI
jgi:3-phenylpropionate/trans-cinnamate dioxygenase ferredoxin subunit